MEIKLCTSDKDIMKLSVLAKSIWNSYFLGIITQEQIDYMVDMYQSYHALTKAINEDHYTYFVAYEDEEMIGYCGVKPDGDRLFLSKLYLKEDKRGKGIASKLFQKALVMAKDNDLSAIYLTCNKYNQHSLDVYIHSGFITIDSVQTDIGKGFIMDDYIMQLDL